MARRRTSKISENQEKQKARKIASRAAGSPALRKRTGPNWPLLALSLAGVALTAYLSISSWLEAEPLFCGKGSSCDIIQNSRWGSLLGVPTAFWGSLAYLALAYIAYRERNRERHWKFAWTISLIGLAYSVYLTVVSFTVIQAACSYCLASLALMATIFLTVAFQRPKGLPGFTWPAWAGQTAVLAALIVGGMHLHYSGVFDPSAGPEDPYLKALANHMSQSGVIFYGAFW